MPHTPSILDSMFALLFRTFPESHRHAVSSDEEDSEEERDREARKKQRRREASRAQREREREKQEEEEEEEEIAVPAAKIHDDAVCDIQCFYCSEIMRAADRFVLCERCEGFVSCVHCWRRTEFEPYTYSLADLEHRQTKLLARDASRQHKLWPRLHEHKFGDSSHADWTDPDSGDFNTYTYKTLAALREAGLTGTVGYKRKEPTAATAATTPVRRTTSAPHSAPAAAAAAASSSSAAASQKSPREAPSSAPYARTAARSLFDLCPASQMSSKSTPNKRCPVRSSSSEDDDKENDAAPPRSKAKSVNKGAPSSLTQSIFRMEQAKPAPVASTLLLDQQPQQGAAAAASSSNSKPTAIITDAPPSPIPCPPPDEALAKLYASKPLAYSSAIEVRASAHLPPLLGQPCELGVFAKEPIPMGAAICYYASHQVYKKHVRLELSSHARRLANTDLVLDGIPTARLFSRYIAHTVKGIAGVLSMPAVAFLPRTGTDKANLLAQLAIGCMINSPAGRRGDRPVNPNVLVRHMHTKDSDGLQLGAVHCLYAKFNIKIGEELLCCYNNGEERGDREWQATATTVAAAAVA